MSSSRADQSGRYQIDGLPPHEDYLILAVQGLEAGQAGDPDFLARVRNQAAKLTLGDGETKTVDLKLSAGVKEEDRSMRCKQCGGVFEKGQGHELWELRRQYVQPEADGETAHVHMEDAGLFCSRNCVKDYLKPATERSGIFDVKRKPTL